MHDEARLAEVRHANTLKLAEAQARYNNTIQDLGGHATNLNRTMTEVSKAMAETSDQMSTMDPEMGAMAKAGGGLIDVWNAYSQGQGGVQDAVAGSVGAIGQAAMAFTDDTALMAGIAMAMEIANAAAALASYNYPKMAAHIVSAGLYAAVLGMAAGGGGGAAAGGGGAGAQASNQGPPGGGEGGFGDTEGGGRTVIVQFGSGVVLGRAADVARGVAQAANAARGTGTGAAY